MYNYFGLYYFVILDQHYNEATGILITFLVNNYQDVRMNGMARAWEEEMKLFVQNFSSPNMTISYAIQVHCIIRIHLYKHVHVCSISSKEQCPL